MDIEELDRGIAAEQVPGEQRDAALSLETVPRRALRHWAGAAPSLAAA